MRRVKFLLRHGFCHTCASFNNTLWGVKPFGVANVYVTKVLKSLLKSFNIINYEKGI